MRQIGNGTQFRFSESQRGIIEIPSTLIRDTVGLLFDITPISFEQNSGLHRNRNWYAKNFIFSQLEADAFAVRRTRTQIANGEHLVFIHRYVDGYLRGRIGDLNIDREPGYIYVLDQASDVECVQRPAVMQNIIIPKSLLGYSANTHPPLISFNAGEGLGRAMNALFDELFDDLLNENAVEHETFNHLIACIKFGLGTAPADANMRSQVRLAIKQAISSYVEQNLDQWDLSVQSILKNFGVSRASLYRMFEDRGGVRQFISDRRLLRAVLDISKGPLLRGKIAAAAEKWGFSSGANFNRAIRREFGVTPGSLINLPDEDASILDRPLTLNDYRLVADQSVERVAGSELLVPA